MCIITFGVKSSTAVAALEAYRPVLAEEEEEGHSELWAMASMATMPFVFYFDLKERKKERKKEY